MGISFDRVSLVYEYIKFAYCFNYLVRKYPPLPPTLESKNVPTLSKWLFPVKEGKGGGGGVLLFFHKTFWEDQKYWQLSLMPTFLFKEVSIRKNTIKMF